MKSIVNRLKESAFFQNVSILAIGSIVAQAITIGASPILTRLYSPESFAAFALFFAIVSALLPGVCGSYDIAIVVGESEEESRGLLTIALLFSSLLCGAGLILLSLFLDQLKGMLNAGALDWWLYFVPAALFLSSLITALRYFANSRKEYGVISKIVLIQAVSATVATVLLGLLKLEVHGLLAGNLLGSLLTGAWAVHRFRRTISFQGRAALLALARKYRDFPLFNAGGNILNALAASLPVFFITKYYPESITGYYALMTKVATAPLSFISSSVSQVHMKQVSSIVNSGQRPRGYLIKITLILAGIVILPSLVLLCFGPSIFAWVFGERWRMAGELLRILMPALALRFVVSTVSPVFAATGHNRMGAFWQISYLACTFAMFLFLAPRLDVKGIFVAMLITNIVLYLFYYLLIWHAFHHPRRLGGEDGSTHSRIDGIA